MLQKKRKKNQEGRACIEEDTPAWHWHMAHNRWKSLDQLAQLLYYYISYNINIE